MLPFARVEAAVLEHRGFAAGVDQPRLAELASTPTLVVSAAHDPIARPTEGGRAIAAGIPGARYVEIPDASHGVPIHQAPRINALLLEHFAPVDAASE